MNNILNIISSSSKDGNCYIYNQDLMIDIGVSFAKIKSYIKDIKLLCLTHEHSDHLRKKTIQKLIYEKPTIKIVCGEWLVQTIVDIGVNKKNIFVLKLNKKYDLGKYIIELVPAIHDVDNCGYKITIKENNYRIFHITDTASIEHLEAKNYNMFAIEANYNEELLEEHINQALESEDNKNKLLYLNRVKMTHLSDTQCNDFLISNMGNNSEYVKLHQSDYNYKEID